MYSLRSKRVFLVFYLAIVSTQIGAVPVFRYRDQVVGKDKEKGRRRWGRRRWGCKTDGAVDEMKSEENGRKSRGTISLAEHRVAAYSCYHLTSFARALFAALYIPTQLVYCTAQHYRTISVASVLHTNCSNSDIP